MARETFELTTHIYAHTYSYTHSPYQTCVPRHHKYTVDIDHIDTKEWYTQSFTGEYRSHTRPAVKGRLLHWVTLRP